MDHTDKFPIVTERDMFGSWTVTVPDVITDLQAAQITFRANPQDLTLGAFIRVVDNNGIRIGHVSGATYQELNTGTGYVVCTITLR